MKAIETACRLNELSRHTRITIVFPYYNNEAALVHNIGTYQSYPQEILRHLDFLIVDDCSSKPLHHAWNANFWGGLYCSWG